MAMMIRISGMHSGKIPFKYLGVNISPKRLGVNDCQCLIDNVTTRIRSLGARKLSYAGRVALIKAVLSTLHNYWARIFILPKTILAKIDSLCRQFLWHDNDFKESPALVAWEQICKAKKKGGLGLKNLYCWNIAAVGKYVWWIAQKTDHLWVRWIHAVYMKDKEWEDYVHGSGVSWAWRKICWVKDLVKHHMFNDTLTDYTIKLGYGWLVDEGRDVSWHAWTSNSLIVPKHGFIIWLLAHRRLLTQDRLVRMGITHLNCCYLCGDDKESLEHLFFQCSFSRRCLAFLSDWLQLQLPDKNFLSWWVQLRCRSLQQKQAITAVLDAAVYFIWWCRNKCRLEELVPMPVVGMKICKKDIQMRLSRCRHLSKFAKTIDWFNKICSN
ncbi:uncharacterized protein LOC141640854 [Silene latifolia]|uniref:uncharacterized protein LOC141640854 n=1 Tax=Silene latifolia TaxID=37657 RepID=UPI003D76E0C1